MNWSPSKYPLIINPYESFMKKHLEHYGYYSGRSMAIAKLGYEPRRFNKNDYTDESDTESDCESDTATKKLDWKNRPNKFNDNYKWWLKDNNYTVGMKGIEYQREPRWPTEMQVLPEKIRHIQTPFNEVETFYQKTGREEMPMPSPNDAKTKTVFYYNPINVGYYMRSRVGGNRDGCQKLCQEAVPGIEQENTLMFESRFESGNLMKAVKVNDTDYELYMRYDMYTNRHTQWFYFQIKNAKPNHQYRFTLCNFLKSDSLYNQGMKPVMYSELDAANKNIGWRRWGTNIKYYRNNIRSEDEYGNTRSLYSLTWTCTFPNENDTYYFAHCYPYTYTDLQDYIKNVQDDPVKSKFCKVKILTRSLAENLVHLMTITNPNPESENFKKKAVVITARVHPGETNSSWMMKGFLDFLLSNTADAKLLRDNFVFKIVPMLNPDGVIVGNYRCSLTGRDLNRNYKTMLKDAFPSIWHTREMVRKLLHEREVILYCDLHGHSRKNNVFIYGCHNNNSSKRRFHEHIFPIIMSRNGKSHFSYKSCKFKIQKSKQGTGRIVMYHLGVMNSFTMESTFNGSTLNDKKDHQFGQRDLEELGYIFCDSILDYCDPDQTKCKQILRDVENQMRETLRIKLGQRGINLDNMVLMEDFDILSYNFDEDEDASSVGSDSSGDDGLPLHLERFGKASQRKALPSNTQAANKNEQKKISKDQNDTEENLQINNNPNKTNNKSMSEFIQKANEATLMVNFASTKPDVKLNNINMIAERGFSQQERKEKSTVQPKEKEQTLIKDTEKKLLRPLKTAEGSASNGNQGGPTSAKSTKTNHGIPVFTEERANIKKNNQNCPECALHGKYKLHSSAFRRDFVELQMQLENETTQLKEENTSFRYTLNSEMTRSIYSTSPSALCEHHRKKLSDLFLIRHLTETKAESDGNVSDDEADLIEELEYEESTGGDKRPTLEEYVKKHVFKRSESQNYSRLSKKNAPLIITFQTPVSQSVARVRSERGFHQIETTPTTNYNIQQQSPPSKSRLNKAKNESVSKHETKLADKQNLNILKKEEDQDIVIFKSDITEPVIKSDNEKSDEISESLLFKNTNIQKGQEQSTMVTKSQQKQRQEDTNHPKDTVQDLPKNAIQKPPVANYNRSNTKTGTAEAYLPSQVKTPVARKPLQENLANPSTPQNQHQQKQHKIEMNVESIITETLLQSQQSAKREAEINRLKRQSPDLDEHIEEDIIVYQNNKNTPKESSRHDKAKSEKNTTNSDAFTIFSQIQKRNYFNNENNTNNFASNNRSMVMTNEIHKKNEETVVTDNNRQQNVDTIIYQNPKSQKQLPENQTTKKISIACENNFQSDFSVVSDKAVAVATSLKNRSSSRGPKLEIKNETNLVNLNSSNKNREKIAVEVQKFNTDLKPHQDLTHNRMQLLQNKIKEEKAHNIERHQNFNYQQNNHHVHMLKAPHLDVKKIQFQTTKDSYNSDSINQKFNNSKYENSTDPFEFKSELSIVTNNNNGVNTAGNNNNNKNQIDSDQQPKYLLKQVYDTRVNKQSKNSGNSPAFGSMSLIITSQGVIKSKVINTLDSLEPGIVSARQFREYENIARDIARRKRPDNNQNFANNSKNCTKMFGNDLKTPLAIIESTNTKYKIVSEEFSSSLNSKTQANPDGIKSFREFKNQN